MSPEATLLFLFIAFVAFVVAAVLAFVPRSYVLGFIATGLASWVFVSLWTAMKAI